MARDLEQLIEQRFDDASACSAEPPAFVLVMGGIAVGKTKIRSKKYSKGFVVVDAAEIFLELCDGAYHDFPSIFEGKLNVIGETIVGRAINERRNIVCEVIGDDPDSIAPLITALKQNGYRVSIEAITCDLEESIRRNEGRSDNDISSYYTQDFHIKWLSAVLCRQRHKSPLH
jgi:hypothetical protein